MVESLKNVANRDCEVVLKTTELSGFLHSLFLPAAKPRRSMDHKLVIGGRGVVSFSVPNKFVI